MASCLLTPPLPHPLTFYWAAVPGLHTGKALCHIVFSDITSKSSSLAWKTWIPAGFLAPQTADALCVSWRHEATAAMESSGWNAFSTTCVPLDSASLLLLVKGDFKRLGCMRFTMHCWTEEIMRPLEVSWCLRRCARVRVSNVNIRTFDCICWSKGTEHLKSELWMVSMPLRSQKTNDLFFFCFSISWEVSLLVSSQFSPDFSSLSPVFCV